MDHELTQKQLGKQLGMTESAVSRLESGQHSPSMATVDRVMCALRKRIVFVDERDRAAASAS
jgi:transcriptional regulator with XRE-family HTH domain